MVSSKDPVVTAVQRYEDEFDELERLYLWPGITVVQQQKTFSTLLEALRTMPTTPYGWSKMFRLLASPSPYLKDDGHGEWLSVFATANDDNNCRPAIAEIMRAAARKVEEGWR